MDWWDIIVGMSYEVLMDLRDFLDALTWKWVSYHWFMFNTGEIPTWLKGMWRHMGV